MSSLVEVVVAAGGPLLVGATVILLVGWIGSMAQRSPIARQRFGELAILASLIWLLSPLLPVARSDSHSARLATPVPEIVWDAAEREAPAGEQAVANDSANSALDGMTAADFDLSDSSIVEFDSQEFAPTELPSSCVEVKLESPEALSLPATIIENRKANNSVAAVLPARRMIQSMIIALVSGLPVAYLVGAVAVLLWLIMGHVTLGWLIRQGHPAERWILDLVKQPGAKRPPRVLVSARCHRVMTFGLFRPTIVLPQELAHPKNASQLRHVILHELGHIYQRDAVGQWLLNIAFVFFYFHPLYWLIRRRICFDRELVIDDWAARQSSKSNYVSDLVALARSQSAARGPFLAMGAVNYPQTQFYRRIKMLVHRQHALNTRRSRPVALFHWLVMLTLVVATLNWIDVPRVMAQQREADAYQTKIDELAAERDKLLQQVKEYQDRLAQMEAVVADLRLVAESKQNQEAEQSRRVANMLRIQQLEAQLQKVQADREAALAKSRTEHATLLAQMDQQAKQRAQETDVAQTNEQQLRAQISQLTQQLHKLQAQQNQPPDQKSNVKESVVASDLVPESQRPAGVPPTTLSSSVTNDLIQLATSYADALSERDISAAEIHHMQELVAKNAASKYQLDVAKIRHESTRRKAEMLQQVAEATLRSLEVELQQAHEHFDYTQQLVKKGFVSKSELSKDRARLIQIESNIDILRRILTNK